MQPPLCPLFGMSELELTALREFLNKSLNNGFIQPSNTLACVPVLFVKKKDGSHRLCVDYCGLNAITVHNHYSLQLIQETLDQVGKARIYTKLDLRGAYNLVQIKIIKYKRLHLEHATGTSSFLQCCLASQTLQPSFSTL